jgi:predicted CoA-binding protein
MKTIAVLGASSDRSKFGNKCVRAYVHAGWEVFPINPSAGVIEGRQVSTSLEDVTGSLDRISVYLPPALTLRLLPEIAARKAAEVWFNPGSADSAVLAEARRLGLPLVADCSIVDIGLSPSQFPRLSRDVSFRR